MLEEFQSVRQHPGDRRRRWFCDNYFDLVVWYEPTEEIFGFQLSYDRLGKPRAFTWRRPYGMAHEAVDDGDDPLLKYKQTPILVPDGAPDMGPLIRRFTDAAAGLPDDIRELVLDKLSGFGG
jgi:hypothetical protein